MIGSPKNSSITKQLQELRALMTASQPGIVPTKLSQLADDIGVSGKAQTPIQATKMRALNTIFQLSTTRPAIVSYSIQILVSATIAGGQTGDVILEIATNAAFTTGVQSVAITGLGQTYSLAIAIQGVQPQTGVLAGLVPAGYYARLRTAATTGAPAFSVRAGQEILL